MINLYAYTYPAASDKFDGYILTKIGDSTREADIRIAEQGGAAEWEDKIKVGTWNKLENIYRDFAVHKELDKLGLHHKGGAGTEWFKIPATSEKEAFNFIDGVVQKLEGRTVRNKVVLRQLQQQKLDQAMELIANGKSVSTVIANLCPRFGKTIWSLMLFNKITEAYGNRVMLLPAYWLSVHTSFGSELNKFEDFLDIVEVSNEEEYKSAMEAGKRVIIPMSLHGEYESWITKNQWISEIPNDDIFMFADEGDFGTHADNQVKKLEFILQSQ